MTLTRLIALVALFLAVAAPLYAQQPAPATPPDPEKMKAIRTLIDLTGTAKGFQTGFERSIEQQKAQNPSIPAEFWTRFRAKVKVDELLERFVPVYDRHFTLDEVNQLIAFYQSPVGKKLATDMPQIMIEVTQIEEKYGKEKALEAASEMQQAHPQPKPAPAAKDKGGS